MPKVNLGRNRANEKLVAVIWGAAAAQGLDNCAQLAEKCGFSRNTLARRKRSPEDFTIGELRTIGRRLGIPAEELRSAIMY